MSSGRASASTKQRFAVDLRDMKRGGLRGLAGLFLPRLLEQGSSALLRRGNQELELGRSATGRGWEESLGEGEERLRSLIQHTSDVVTLLEADGTILYESPSIERILGYRPEELVGKNVFAYVHPQDLERVLSAFAAGLANPELRPSAEYRFRHKDGSWRYLESVGSNLLDDPNVGELVVNSRDVTERKKAEERLREAEARYRTLVEQIPAIAYVEELSRNGKVLAYMSPQYEAMLGYSPETGTPHPEHWLEIVHPDDRERVLAEDTRTDETLEPFRAEYRMLAKDGRVVWIRDEARVVRDEGGRPLFWQGVMFDITERKVLEERLKQWALHDPLTGLANRTLFADRLEHALARLDRREESIAVLLVDLDHFKVINDSLGHEVGDRLLAGMSKRLRACVRPEDTVARFGGDEFAVLLEDVAQLSGAKQAAERIVRALSSSFELEEHEVFTSASAGVALSSAATDKPQDLLRNADLALYEAKRKGKARYEVFDVNVSTAFLNRMELGDALRRALEREEFRVYYQPRVSVSTGRIVSFEALVRWEHPERGILEPGDFLSIAEETGLIVLIGEWVLREVCRQGRIWQERYAQRTSPRVSMNVSPRQFLRSEFIEEVTVSLEESGLEANNLSLEIAESGLMDDPVSAIDRLRALKDLGVHVAIDGFGVACSPLSQLKRFPLDLLNLDRSLIVGHSEEPADVAIVAAMIDIAHALGWTVTAQGVETIDQLAQLRKLGCDLAQGYYFSKPVTGEEASALRGTGTQLI